MGWEVTCPGSVFWKPWAGKSMTLSPDTQCSPWACSDANHMVSMLRERASKWWKLCHFTPRKCLCTSFVVLHGVLAHKSDFIPPDLNQFKQGEDSVDRGSGVSHC